MIPTITYGDRVRRTRLSQCIYPFPVRRPTVEEAA